ncbi:MAG TPA: hypothetical protein VK629_16600 [Steroidobacteraceae bacterium]|nr:hypothetical protein [Steroidobacteraceae bacterium]
MKTRIRFSLADYLLLTEANQLALRTLDFVADTPMAGIRRIHAERIAGSDETASDFILPYPPLTTR